MKWLLGEGLKGVLSDSRIETPLEMTRVSVFRTVCHRPLILRGVSKPERGGVWGQERRGSASDLGTHSTLRHVKNSELCRVETCQAVFKTCFPKLLD